jgi:hypothetical protein
VFVWALAPAQEAGSGTNVTRCINVPVAVRRQSEKDAWHSLPGRLGMLDFRIYHNEALGVYEVLFRNRSALTIHFNYEGQGGSPPARTTYRATLRPRSAEAPPGTTVTRVESGGRACVRVNRIRFDLDTGTYR